MGYSQTQLLSPMRVTTAASGLTESRDTLVPILRSSYASINFATTAPFLPDQIGFNLFGDVNLVAQRVESKTLPDGTLIWYGRIPDPRFDHLPHYRNVIISADPAHKQLIATVFYKGKEYEIKPLPLARSASARATGTAQIHQVIELGKTSSTFCDSTFEQPPLATKNARVAAAVAEGEANCEGVYIIDVLVSFSDIAASRSGGNPTLVANQMINRVNNALHNSLVENVRLRLVGVVRAPRNAGIYGNVLAVIDDWHAADMVATGADYLVAVQGYPGEARGIAYKPGNRSVVESNPSPWSVFAHEIGHSVGGGHCRGGGDRPYANGFGPTIQCGDDINFYSNPDVVVDGSPIGNTTTSNMARRWRERAQAMASVRTHKMPYACLADSCPTPTLTARGLGTKPGLVLLSEVMVPAECIRPNTTWSSLNGKLATRPVETGIQQKAGGPTFNNRMRVGDLVSSTLAQSYTEYQLPAESIVPYEETGTGLQANHPMPWKTDVWYTTVLRRWSTGDNKTRVGLFMYDYGTGQWTHYVTVVTPDNNAFFLGNSLTAYLDQISGQPNERCGLWRNFWKLNQDKTWNKATQIDVSGGDGAWKAEKSSAKEVKLFTCTGLEPPRDLYSFTMTMPETKPSVVTTALVNQLSPAFANGSLNVGWQVDPSRAPQLSYRIEVYDNANFSGTPLAQVSGIDPEARSAGIPFLNFPPKNYYVRLLVTDIFEQESNVVWGLFSNANTCNCR
ncbi:hypothetical protein GCM10028819_07900 [Spirosoma humi]